MREGMGFPAIHNDRTGTAMLMAAGVPLEAARDWSNGGCVVPHGRKLGEWTAAANINLGSALEFALNDGRQRSTGTVQKPSTGKSRRPGAVRAVNP